MIEKRRTTANQPPEGTAVFLIGMRVNKPWRLHEWLGVFVAMPRMLAHLATHPEAGLLSYDVYLGRTVMLVSYWSSAESLRTFASAAEAPHASAWRRFGKRLAGSGSVGIWHETYVVGEHEAVYSGMPAFGLGKAVGTRLVGPGTATAKQRLAASASA
jgi:hypothetical protein